MYEDLYTYFYDKFNETSTIDQDFTPTTIYISPRDSDKYGIMIDGDFDKMHITVNSDRFTITKTNATQKLPTWLAIAIIAKASLFNLQNKWMLNGNVVIDPTTDAVNILGYTYIDLNYAPWNKQNTTL